MHSDPLEPATRRETLLFLVRAAVFILLTLAVLSYGLYVLTPKDDFGICSMTNLYQQPEGSVDVLALGTSLAYSGINTNVLWAEYGIAAYNLCGAEQPYWISYHLLREALKTQRPRLILMDAKASIYQRDYSSRGRVFMGAQGIADPLLRLQAIRASVREEDFLSFALGYPQLHGFYSQVRWESFVYPPDNGGRGPDWKGYIEATDTEKHQRPSLVFADTKRPMNPRQEEYCRKILLLAREENIPLLLIGIPNPDYANDHMYYNSLWSLAEELGVPYINYNTPDRRFGLTYSSCFADWQHLNVKGSVIFSRRLGQDLQTQFNLPDRRGDARYDSWQRCAENWYRQYPDYRPEGAEGEIQ